jgi:hypothetical protein
MSWVETQVPCMIYCGDELCNCEARFFYEEEDDWSILDKKGQEAKSSYERYLARLQVTRLTGCQAVAPGQSKVIYISSANATVSALK